jgi:DNA-3-methyladenine glycosylase I
VSAAYCRAAPSHPLHGPYHDSEYGFPADDEAVLFERLVLEINQAGLSWLTVLQKRAAGIPLVVDPVMVAKGGARLIDPDALEALKRLLIAAVIANARRIQELRRSHGRSRAGSTPTTRCRRANGRAFRQNFRFTGGLIVGEFLMSFGYLPARTSQTARLCAFWRSHHLGRGRDAGEIDVAVDCGLDRRKGRGHAGINRTLRRQSRRTTGGLSCDPDARRGRLSVDVDGGNVVAPAEISRNRVEAHDPGAIGMAVRSGPQHQSRGRPGGPAPSPAQGERVSDRLAAIREAVSAVGGVTTDASGEQRLAWGNWGWFRFWRAGQFRLWWALEQLEQLAQAAQLAQWLGQR